MAMIHVEVVGTSQPEKSLPSTAPNMSPNMEFGHPTSPHTFVVVDPVTMIPAATTDDRARRKGDGQ
jgi:hypothetical protein